jgi:glucoamylase
VTDTSLGFFSQFLPDIDPGTYFLNRSQYSAIKVFADGFVQFAASYTPSDGGLAEQFDKGTCHLLSAADLTWSYASVLMANDSHTGIKPAGWCAKGLVVPSVCVSNPWPQVDATFSVNATTFFGLGVCTGVPGRITNDQLLIHCHPENIYRVGSVDALKDWYPDNALSMNPVNYSIWSGMPHRYHVYAPLLT